MDEQLEQQQDVSVGPEECVEDVQSHYKSIGIQAVPEIAIAPEVSHFGKK